MALSIRTRLTIWNGIVTAFIIGALGSVVYVALGAALLERIDSVLSFEYRETVERLENLDIDEDLGGVPEAFLEEFLLRISDPLGAVKMQSPSLSDVPWNVPTTTGATFGPQFATVDVGSSGQHRLILGTVGGSHDGWIVQIASPLAAYHRQMGDLRKILFAIFPMSLLIALASGYWLAGQALAPVERITATARRIRGDNLAERIVTDREDDELGRLAATLNSMIERLAGAVESMRRFTADASHELMTPLTQIRAEAEVTLQLERTTNEYTDVLRSIIEEVDRLARLASQLLLLAREDASRTNVEQNPVEIADLMKAVTDAARPAAAVAHVQVILEQLDTRTNGIIEFNEDRLRQILENLLQNAVQYNRPGGVVRVSAEQSANQATITVADTGIGIPPESMPHLFDRFYRAEGSRNRRSGGSGLGLSIAHSLAQSIGARIEVESAAGLGSTFRVILPLNQPR